MVQSGLAVFKGEYRESHLRSLRCRRLYLGLFLALMQSEYKTSRFFLDARGLHFLTWLTYYFGSALAAYPSHPCLE